MINRGLQIPTMNCYLVMKRQFVLHACMQTQIECTYILNSNKLWKLSYFTYFVLQFCVSSWSPDCQSQERYKLEDHYGNLISHLTINNSTRSTVKYLVGAFEKHKTFFILQKSILTKTCPCNMQQFLNAVKLLILDETI